VFQTPPLPVQRQQPRQHLLVRQVGRPAVGGEDGGVELAVGQVEPGGPLVVEAREGAPERPGRQVTSRAALSTPATVPRLCAIPLSAEPGGSGSCSAREELFRPHQQHSRLICDLPQAGQESACREEGQAGLDLALTHGHRLDLALQSG